MNKQAAAVTPWRSRPYLDLSYVESKTCVRCGKVGCEPCHYSGQYSDRLGKGGSQKSMDAAVADLCRECHVYFDLYHAGNDDVRAAEFLLLVLVTLHRNLQMGLVTLERTELGFKESPLRPQPAERATKRRKTSRCTASAKQVKRPAGGFSP